MSLRSISASLRRIWLAFPSSRSWSTSSVGNMLLASMSQRDDQPPKGSKCWCFKWQHGQITNEICRDHAKFSAASLKPPQACNATTMSTSSGSCLAATRKSILRKWQLCKFFWDAASCPASKDDSLVSMTVTFTPNADAMWMARSPRPPPTSKTCLNMTPALRNSSSRPKNHRIWGHFLLWKYSDLLSGPLVLAASGIVSNVQGPSNPSTSILCGIHVSQGGSYPWTLRRCSIWSKSNISILLTLAFLCRVLGGGTTLPSWPSFPPVSAKTCCRSSLL